ncbi:helix-turn-helix domain-containing protein [Candidatus Woesearchaeota archaeon]|nr:helix-turn-helix domain-containing protein [Candidatus Woesearchaeota archaeon]
MRRKMTKTYLLREKNNELYYSKAIILDNPASLKILDHPIRQKILRLLNKKPMYPAQLAKDLNMHEQKIYYHMKQLSNAGVIEISSRKDIRGTTAKKFSPKCMNFAVSLSKDWKGITELLEKKDSSAAKFLSPFIKKNKIDADIIVGSPDPHGPHKARARDGHYAIDLAIFLGKFCSVRQDFVTRLDVDLDLDNEKNLIIVGGPVTNLICGKINDFLPAKFSDKKPWGIRTKNTNYTDDSVGLIARISNPYHPDYKILLIAGIRFIGTKAAVMGFTRNINLVLNRFSGQEKFYCVVQGFDLDGDGKIDSVEVLE